MHLFKYYIYPWGGSECGVGQSCVRCRPMNAGPKSFEGTPRQCVAGKWVRLKLLAGVYEGR